MRHSYIPPALTAPDRWLPHAAQPCDSRPPVGALIGWRYAAWRVVEVRTIADYDLTQRDEQLLARHMGEDRERLRPYVVVLAHRSGPLLVDKTTWLDDGSVHVHVGVRAGGHHLWNLLADRYPTCSCHGHPWPCQDHDRDVAAESAADALQWDLATTTPGVCAACLQPVTARQGSITFPEPSLLVPGGPPPVFHTRRDCWYAAQDYELHHRLPAHPGADRLVTCPGTLFVHAAGGVADCSAGSGCTGHHAPPNQTRPDIGRYCYTLVRLADGSTPHPTRRCASPRCRGTDGPEEHE